MAAPTYTFQMQAPPTEPGQLSWFGNLRRDGARAELTGALGNGFQTSDYTTSPVTSPVSVAANSVTTILVPPNAASITIITKTQSVLVSEASANSGLSSWSTNYAEIPVNTPTTIDVGLQSTIYLLASTSTAVVSFWFQIV